jgi:hypothetical protein
MSRQNVTIYGNSPPDSTPAASPPNQLEGNAGASEDWRRAAVAGGENPAQAEAAAKRTTAFYTGEEIQEG